MIKKRGKKSNGTDFLFSTVDKLILKSDKNEPDAVQNMINNGRI